MTSERQPGYEGLDEMLQKRVKNGRLEYRVKKCSPPAGSNSSPEELWYPVLLPPSDVGQPSVWLLLRTLPLANEFGFPDPLPAPNAFTPERGNKSLAARWIRFETEEVRLWRSIETTGICTNWSGVLPSRRAHERLRILPFRKCKYKENSKSTCKAYAATFYW